MTWAWVAITGIAPDGERHLITEPQFALTAFDGTAWDWFAAVLAGR